MDNLLTICKSFADKNPGYEYFGLRADDREFEIGDEMPKSYVWDDGNRTDERLDGTCAIRLYVGEQYNEGALDEVNIYPFDHVYLIASRGYMGGEDKNEIVMYEAVVVEKLK